MLESIAPEADNNRPSFADKGYKMQIYPSSTETTPNKNTPKIPFKVVAGEQGKSIFQQKIEIKQKPRNKSMRPKVHQEKENEVKLTDINSQMPGMDFIDHYLVDKQPPPLKIRSKISSKNASPRKQYINIQVKRNTEEKPKKKSKVQNDKQPKKIKVIRPISKFRGYKEKELNQTFYNMPSKYI